MTVSQNTTGRQKAMDKTMESPQRRVRHDVADSIAVMGFSLGTSIAIAALIAFIAKVAW